MFFEKASPSQEHGLCPLLGFQQKGRLKVQRLVFRVFRVFKKIDTRFSLGCESTNLSVERSDKDKDTDEDVDADPIRTGRPVGGHWSHQLEEIDIDFRISGLPHDSCNWQCRVIRVMRNSSKSAMLRMPSLLESKHSLLHLWTSFERKLIQPRYPPITIGYSFNPELYHQEGATTWQSSWED